MIPFQLIVMVGLAVVYMVTGGKSMQRVYRFQCEAPGSCPSFGLSCWILVFAGIQFVLSQVRAAAGCAPQVHCPHSSKMNLGFCKVLLCSTAGQSLLHCHCHRRPSASARTRATLTKCDWVQLPNFNSLRIVSLSAAVMSLAYSTIAIGTSISNGKQPGAAYNLDGHSVADSTFGAFNALGTIAFAYGGHNVVLEIQVRAHP